jgi:hypothetical protein
MKNRSRSTPARKGWSLLVIALLVALAAVRAYRNEQREAGPDTPEITNRVPEHAAPVEGSTAEPALPESQPGRLRDVGDDILVSSAGLRYVPGSREGHRLKHVLLHTRDQPDRAGSHGVFDGGRETTLAVIDEAYTIARQRGPPVRMEVQGDRTVYTVDMGRRVGYVGGRPGQREGHPPTFHVRLVLEGDDVITAFPLIP